jgi:hypothetical protein
VVISLAFSPASRVEEAEAELLPPPSLAAADATRSFFPCRGGLSLTADSESNRIE